MALVAKSCDDIFNHLLQEGVTPEELYNSVCKQVCYFHPNKLLICVVCEVH